MPAAGRLGDKSYVSTDAHGCPACPHQAVGPAVSGSSDVLINSLPALRVGDRGIHAACCGSNTWEAVEGSRSVFINGRPAHRWGDAGQHCGGLGHLVEGSPDVFIGDHGASAPVRPAASALQRAVLLEAARCGTPFCQQCEEVLREESEGDIDDEDELVYEAVDAVEEPDDDWGDDEGGEYAESDGQADDIC